jgi:RNA polymerase sigma-32 factor
VVAPRKTDKPAVKSARTKGSATPSAQVTREPTRREKRPSPAKRPAKESRKASAAGRGSEGDEGEETAGHERSDEDDDAIDVQAEVVDTDTADVPVSPPSSSIARFDAMSAYLREVQRHPLLTPEETHALAVKFLETQDPAAAARMVTANLRLVVKIAYEYRRAYKNIMDLVQEGNIGLMQAVKRYDPYRGVKLSSYAAWWIRAYILRFILNNWRLVKLGTTQAQRKLFFNLRKKRAELEALGIDPTNLEVAKQLNVPESEVADMEARLSSGEKSLDAPVGDSEGRSISKIDMMPSALEGPESRFADEEVQALLKQKLASFRTTLVGKDKEVAIFDERLVSEEPLTLQELGDRFGISRERVRQLEQRLTGKLREFLIAEMGDAASGA